MSTVSIPSGSQLIVDVEDIKMLREIKKAISLIRGVSKVSSLSRKRMSAYERSMQDLKEGKVYDYEKLEDLIKEIEG